MQLYSKSPHFGIAPSCMPPQSPRCRSADGCDGTHNNPGSESVFASRHRLGGTVSAFHPPRSAAAGSLLPNVRRGKSPAASVSASGTSSAPALGALGVGIQCLRQFVNVFTRMIIIDHPCPLQSLTGAAWMSHPLENAAEVLGLMVSPVRDVGQPRQGPVPLSQHVLDHGRQLPRQRLLPWLGHPTQVTPSPIAVPADRGPRRSPSLLPDNTPRHGSVATGRHDLRPALACGRRARRAACSSHFRT